MFKEASKLRLRVSTNRGSLSVEQLWDLSVTELDALAVSLEKAYNESGKKSFVQRKSPKDKLAKLAFDVVLEILTTKVEEQEAIKEAKDIKDHNNKILGLIADKKDDALKGKSVKELEKLLR